MSTTNTALQKATENLPEKVKELNELQLGWLAMCEVRTKTFKDLQAGELEIQQLLKDAKDQKLDALQENLKKAKGVHEEKKEQRLKFTQRITAKIIEPAMEFEKRNQKLISDVTVIEFDKRKAEN